MTNSISIITATTKKDDLSISFHMTDETKEELAKIASFNNVTIGELIACFVMEQTFETVGGTIN